MDWCGRLGQIREVLRCHSSVVFDWSIPNIFSLPNKVGPVYYSPEIEFLDEIWFLGIHRNDGAVSREWIGLEIWRSDKQPRKMVTYSVGVRNADGTEDVLHRYQMYPQKCRFCTIGKFLLTSVLMSSKAQMAPSGVLTVTCSLWGHTPHPEDDKWFGISGTAKDNTRVEGSAEVCESVKGEKIVSRGAQTDEVPVKGLEKEDLTDDDKEAFTTLRQDLRHLLHSGDDHDVILSINSREFRAHRSMLRVRSPVFADMLKGNSDRSIAIDGCDPDSFGEFLEYVYTGEMRNLSADNAAGLYNAADKYHVPGLKKACVEFLKTSLSTTTVGEVISLAVKIDDDELLELSMAFFAEHLEETMDTTEWKHFLLSYPIQANEICLKAVKSRFRQQN